MILWSKSKWKIFFCFYFLIYYSPLLSLENSKVQKMLFKFDKMEKHLVTNSSRDKCEGRQQVRRSGRELLVFLFVWYFDTKPRPLPKSWKMLKWFFPFFVFCCFYQKRILLTLQLNLISSWQLLSSEINHQMGEKYFGGWSYCCINQVLSKRK